MNLPEFEQGKLYKRSTIHDEFGGSRQSGISPSRQTPAVFIFTGESGEQYGYSDSWDAAKQVFTYTGEGQTGDMTMNGGNAAIRDHVEDGRALHLFAIVSDEERKAEAPDAAGRGYCRYIGEMQCAGVINGTGPDRAGATRKIFQFQLVNIEALPGAETEPEAAPGSTSPASESGSLQALRKKAIQAAGSAKRKSSDAKRTLFERAKHVVDYALARANGSCEACDAPAPFMRTNGNPYLEVHHVDRLSDGGLDAPHRVAAICPTCHRNIHCGEGGSAINDTLRDKIAQLEESLDTEAK